MFLCLQIFGPVLPIMTVKDENEAINFINSRWVSGIYITECTASYDVYNEKSSSTCRSHQVKCDIWNVANEPFSVMDT